MGFFFLKNFLEVGEKVCEFIWVLMVRGIMEFYWVIRMVNLKGIFGGVKYDVYFDDLFEEFFRDGINLWKFVEISCEREFVFCEWFIGYEFMYLIVERLF